MILRQMADHMEKQVNAGKGIKNAMTYPIIAGIVAVVVVAIMVTFVLPAFSRSVCLSGRQTAPYDPLDAQRMAIRCAATECIFWWLIVNPGDRRPGLYQNQPGQISMGQASLKIPGGRADQSSE